MSNQQANFFEKWVRQEQIAYWLMSFVLMTISVLAFFFVQGDSGAVVESNVGNITLETPPSLNIFRYVILAMPAVWGLFILYWTSKRDNVRALTENVLHHHIGRWAFIGLACLIFGALQIFGSRGFVPSDSSSMIQLIVLIPLLLLIGCFALFRAYKLWGFRQVGEVQ